MAVSHWKTLFTVVVFICFSLLASHHDQLVAAMRPLEGEEWAKQDGRLALQSLQRGPVTPSGPNPCGHVPGGSGKCVLGDMNIAGPVLRAPPAFPSLVLDVAVASTDNNNHDHYQDQSS